MAARQLLLACRQRPSTLRELEERIGEIITTTAALQLLDEQA